VEDLIGFLNARLDDVELADWHARDCQTHRQMPANSPLGLGGAPMSCNCRVPAFVLADVAAKRRLLSHYSACLAKYGDGTAPDAPEDNIGWAYVDALKAAAMYLALPYADHPDYQEGWKP